jgi:HAD superfamily hydrolase (TIGR01549 family)
MAALEAILFDLGDTLLDFGAVDTLDLFEQGARLTYDYLLKLDQPLPPFAVYHRRLLRAIRWAYFKSFLVRREFDSLKVLRRVSSQMGHRLGEEHYRELVWLWYEPLSRQAKIEEGLPRVLQELRDKPLKLGVISNTFIPAKVLDRHLEREGLLELLPFRIYSCDVHVRKPHPRIFQAACQLLGSRAEQVMFVGDLPKADVYGAKCAGMVTVLKDPTGKKAHYRVKPDHTIASMAQLPAVVAPYL